MAVGEKVNLLKLIDTAKHKVLGDWVLAGEALIASKGGLLQIPFSPPEEYQLNFTATRLAGKGAKAIHVGLVAEGKQFTAIFDFRDKYTGLHVLDKMADMTVNKSVFVGRAVQGGASLRKSHAGFSNRA